MCTICVGVTALRAAQNALTGSSLPTSGLCCFPLTLDLKSSITVSRISNLQNKIASTEASILTAGCK